MKIVKKDMTIYSTTQLILIMAWVDMPKHVFKSFLVDLKIYFVILLIPMSVIIHTRKWHSVSVS